MESLPTAVVFQMLRNKKSDMVYKMKYKEKSYKLSVYSFTKADIAKISRVEGKAALYVGTFISKGQEFDLHAKSMSIDQIKETLNKNPLVAILAVQKGFKESGEKKFNAVVSVAYKDSNEIDEIKRETLRRYTTSIKRARDSQKKALYKWESKALKGISKIGNIKISLSKINKYAKQIIKFFDLPEDKIHVSNVTTKSATRLGVCRAIRDDLTSDDPNFVILDIHDGTLDTLIHEAAHMVINFKYKSKESQPHGADFCGVYAFLLSQFYEKDVDTILKSMKTGGLSVKKYTGSKRSLKVDISSIKSTGK